jgi:hypothetical protein
LTANGWISFAENTQHEVYAWSIIYSFSLQYFLFQR